MKGSDMTISTREQIREFVSERFPQDTLTDDMNIFASGYVNSLFAMELVLLIEKIVGTQIPNDEVALENFASVDAMTALSWRLGATTDSRQRIAS